MINISIYCEYLVTDMNIHKIIQRKWLLTKYEMWGKEEISFCKCHPPTDRGIPNCYIFLFVMEMKMNINETL